MLALPDDLLELCLARLPPQSIIACASTWKRINKIITTSTVIQLKLNKLLYGDELSRSTSIRSSRCTELLSANDQLSALLRRQKAFEDFEPTRSEYHLGENRKVLCVHGEHIALGLDQAAIRDLEADREGKYTLFDLKPFPTSNPSSTAEVQSRTFNVSFRPDYDTLLVDISKNLAIAMEHSHQGSSHLNLHIFKVFSSHDEPEYQGAKIIDLEPYFGSRDLQYAPTIALGPKDTFTISLGASIRMFCWRGGSHLHSVDLPYSFSLDYSLNWVGADLMVVQGDIEKPLEVDNATDDGDMRGNRFSSCLLVYQLRNLSTTSTKQLLLPALVLSLPAQYCDFPPHIRETMSPNVHLENLSDMEDCHRAASFESETFVLTRSGRPPQAQVVETPHVQYVGARPPATLGEAAIIAPKDWWMYSFWASEYPLSGWNHSHSIGTRLLTCRESVGGYNDWEQGGREVISGRVTIAVLDFSYRILRPHPAVGTALGGSLQVTEMTNFSQLSNPEGIIAMLDEKVHSCSATGEETLEAMCWSRTYTFFEKWIEFMHYDDGAIMVEYSDSTMDIFRF